MAIQRHSSTRAPAQSPPNAVLAGLANRLREHACRCERSNCSAGRDLIAAANAFQQVLVIASPSAIADIAMASFLGVEVWS